MRLEHRCDVDGHVGPPTPTGGRGGGCGRARPPALAACGERATKGTYVGDPAVQSVADGLRTEEPAAYYLGPAAAGLALTDVTRVTENGPDFQVWALLRHLPPGTPSRRAAAWIRSR